MIRERQQKFRVKVFGFKREMEQCLNGALLNYFIDFAKEEINYTFIVAAIYVTEKSGLHFWTVCQRLEMICTGLKDGFIFECNQRNVGWKCITRRNFEGKRFTLRYVGFSTCFRREAGSYGKDRKGILRVTNLINLKWLYFKTRRFLENIMTNWLSLEEKLMK